MFRANHGTGKRTLALLLVSGMLAGLAAGCSQSSQQSSSTPSSSSQSSSTEPASGTPEPENEFAKYEPQEGKTYTIEWLGSHSNAPMPDDAEMKLYWEEKFNVKFNMWYIERSKWNELLNVRIAANEFPDIVKTDGPDTLRGYYDQDMVIELPKELLNHLAPKIYKNVEDVSRDEGIDAWTVTAIEGKNYGIPDFNENGRYVYTSIWRADWLKKVGIETVPKTLDEFEVAFQKFVNEDPDGNGKKDTYALSSGRVSEPFASIYGAFGYIPWYWSRTEDGGIAYGAVQPEMKDALALLNRWYTEGLLNPEFITGENRGGHWSISHDFIEGIIGYTNNGPFYVNAPPPAGGEKGGKMYAAFQAAHENDGAEIVVGQAPIGPDGKCGSIRWGVVTGGNLCFSKKLEEEPDKLGKILQIVETLNCDYDNYMKAFYGIEGKHYKLENGEKTSLIPDGTSSEEFGFGNPFIAFGGIFKFGQRWRPAYYEYAEQYATYSKNYSDALLVSLPSKSKYWDELDKMQKEVYIQIITGAKPVEYFDTFVENWMKDGGEILTAEANDWIQSTLS